MSCWYLTVSQTDLGLQENNSSQHKVVHALSLHYSSLSPELVSDFACKALSLLQLSGETICVFANTAG